MCKIYHSGLISDQCRTHSGSIPDRSKINFRMRRAHFLGIIFKRIDIFFENYMYVRGCTQDPGSIPDPFRIIPDRFGVIPDRFRTDPEKFSPAAECLMGITWSVEKSPSDRIDYSNINIKRIISLSFMILNISDKLKIIFSYLSHISYLNSIMIYHTYHDHEYRMIYDN